jgi:hypothetical protein
MRKRQPNLFIEVAYSRSRSMRTAMGALQFVVEMGRASDAAGRQLDIEEYAEHISISRSQAFRRQAQFRKCFPPPDDVHNVWNIVRPFLDKHDYQTRSPLAQAVFVGTLNWKGRQT